MLKTIGLAGVSFLFLGCGAASKTASDVAHAAEQVAGSIPAAAAVLESKSGSAVNGSAEAFDAGDKGVRIVVRVANAGPGKHGLHLHENGDCSAADASSAGGHLNPAKQNHGAPSTTPHHAGDLGNLEVAADGTGSLEITTKDVSLADGPSSLIGRAVVFHEKADDLTTQPTGGSGARFACGVFKK
jgi:Cu-Zn family superoxide dismutase